MIRRTVNWKWEDPEAQASFADWVGFPGAERTTWEVDRMEALVGLRPPMRVLDVGCGTGRHTLEMARRGYSVVGIDVAQSFIDQARQQAQERGLPAEFRRQRGSELTEREAYDFALAYYHTLGFMSDEEIARHLAAINAALRPGGAFLLVFAGPRVVPGQDGQETRNWAERDGRFILSAKSIQDGYRTELSIMIDPEKKEIVEFQERQRAFRYEEVVSLLRAAGFARVDCLRDLEGAAATPDDFGTFVSRKVDVSMSF